MSNAIRQNKVAQIRRQIRELEARRADVEGTPISRAERGELIRQHFASMAAENARGLKHQLGLFGPGEIGRPFAMTGGAMLDLAPMLAAVLGPDALMTALAPHLDTLPEGIGASERAQQLAEIDADLLRLAHEEQDLIDAAEEEGHPIPYRADARPDVVLRLQAYAK